jgi:hypothetical protein
MNLAAIPLMYSTFLAHNMNVKVARLHQDCEKLVNRSYALQRFCCTIIGQTFGMLKI